MTAFDQDIVLIGTPLQWAVEKANYAAAGYTLSDGVPRSDDGQEPATHWVTLPKVTQPTAAMPSVGDLAGSANPVSDAWEKDHWNLTLHDPFLSTNRGYEPA